MSTWKVEQQTNLLTNETTQSIDVLRMLEERVSDLAGILHNGLQHAQADLDHLWVGGRRQREVQQDFLRSKLVQILNVGLGALGERAHNNRHIQPEVQRLVLVLEQRNQPRHKPLLDDEPLLFVRADDEVLDLCCRLVALDIIVRK